MSDSYGGYGQPDQHGSGDGTPQYGVPPTHSMPGQSQPSSGYGQPPQYGGYGQPPGGGGYGQPPQYPGSYGQYPGPGGQVRPWSALAIVAFVLAWIPCLGIVAIVLGIIALATLRGRRGKGLAIASIVLPILTTTALVVLGVLVGGSVERNPGGEIVEAGTIDFDEVRQGDCLDITGLDDTEASAMDGVPCADPHNAQVLAVADLSDQGSSYPGDRAVETLGSQRCAAQVPGAGPPPGFSWMTFSPNDSDWESDIDSRVVLCLVVDSGYDDFTQDLAN